MTMTAERGPTGKARARRGSAESDTQVAFAVRDGKAVTATLSTGEKVNGYVFGSDDYHWSIVTPDGEIVLVHKASPALQIHVEPTIKGASTMVQALVSHYRNAVLRDVFNQTPPSRQQKKD